MKTKCLYLLTVSFFLLWMTSCSDNSTTSKPNEGFPTIEILGANPDTIMVGDSYVDPGAVAEDVQDGDLSSEIQVTSTLDSSKKGLYEIIYSVEDSDGNEMEAIRQVRVVNSFDTLDIEPENGDYIGNESYIYRIKESHRLNGDLTVGSNATLILGGVLTIEEGDLTIEEGATILFSEEAGIDISTGANLYVLGTSDYRVHFKNFEGKYWGNGLSGGINISADAGTKSNLNFAVFDSAVTAIYTERENGLTIKNSNFMNNKVQGLVLMDKTLLTLDSCDFNLNGLYDLKTYASNIGAITKNQRQDKGFAIDASTVNTNATWPALEYVVSGRINIGEDGVSENQVLKISAGASFRFMEEAYFEVDNGMSIQATGTEEKPVLFKNAEKGKFFGYSIVNTNSGSIWISANAGANNSFNYVVIDSAFAGIYSDREDGLTIKNSRIINSKFYGLILGNNVVKELDNNEFDGNQLYDIYTEVSNINQMTVDQDLDKGIAIQYSDLSNTSTWPALHYIVLDRIIIGTSESPANQILTIDAGARLSFMEEAYLEVTNSFSLQVEGTETKPVIFENAENGKFWGYDNGAENSGGIWIASDAAASHSIDYAQFDSPFTGIYFDSEELNVTNSKFNDFMYYAINMNQGVLVESGNTYVGADSYISNILLLD